ncbi:MAG: hypothetical protein ABW328_10310, partial [Ilumatobacteraceae bacterium]
MDLHDRLFGTATVPADDARWAVSGAMALTGHAGQSALLPPRSLVPFLRAVEAELAPVAPVDAAALLGERAAL